MLAKKVDYVVIGGGTAGSVLAARLSEHQYTRVALLEAGAADGPAAMADSDRRVSVQLRGSSVDWAYSTTPQIGTDGRVHAWASGKVLGGSSSINSMTHLRGHRSSYDKWKEQGAAGWTYESLLPYLKRSESTRGLKSPARGTRGPMQIETPPPASPLALALYQAVLDSGYPPRRDDNSGADTGVSWMERNTVGDRRQSAADAYLRPAMSRPNLTVLTHAFAHRLLLDRRRCYGVEYQHNGELQTIEAERGVVVSAGTVGSARILLHSGIGPAGHLRKVGVPVQIDLPGVGSNLHDHLLDWVSFAGPESAPPNRSRQACLLTRSQEELDPDVIMSFVPYPVGRADLRIGGFSILFSIVTPTSRGSLRLRNADPADYPLIDPAYLKEEHDLDRMVAALRMAVDIAQADVLRPWRGSELLPDIDVRDQQACRTYIRRTCATFYHPVGTCRIGSDELAVVDQLLQVRGARGVWVADASVMPSVVSANTNATVLGIAERAADLILSAYSG